MRYILLLILCPLAAAAESWTQWAGNQRDGTWNEDGIIGDAFPEGGLKPAWSTPIGGGYSGPLVYDGRVFVTDFRPKPETKTLEVFERVLCLDEQTGDIKWTREYETAYRTQLRSYATGPRATPLIDAGRIYTLGATGHIHCLSTADGTVIWKKDAVKDLGAEIPAFAIAASPIAWKDTVIFAAGGRDGYLHALDKATGAVRWKALTATHDLPYSPPVIHAFDGVPQLIQWDQEQLRAVHPDTGKLIWQLPFRARQNMAIARPVKIGNKLLISGFYDGSMLVEVTGKSARVLWKNGGKNEKPNNTKSLHAVITTPIVEGDHFYGTCSYGELRGLRLGDGERVWERKDLTRQGRWGSMFWVKHNRAGQPDRYFVNNDLGELMIMRFTPEGPKVSARTQLIAPDTHCGYGPQRFADALVNWVQPAYANKHVVIRNDSEIRRVSLAAP